MDRHRAQWQRLARRHLGHVADHPAAHAILAGGPARFVDGLLAGGGQEDRAPPDLLLGIAEGSFLAAVMVKLGPDAQQQAVAAVELPERFRRWCQWEW